MVVVDREDLQCASIGAYAPMRVLCVQLNKGCGFMQRGAKVLVTETQWENITSRLLPFFLICACVWTSQEAVKKWAKNYSQKSFACTFYQCYKISTEKIDLVHSTDCVIFKWNNDDTQISKMWIFIQFVVMTIILSEF